MSIAQTIILDTITCGMTGEIGLAPVGANIGLEDYMADTDGVLLAHDLLEHVNGPEHIGGIGDELEALGAIWFGRGQCGDLNRDGRGSMYSPQENIGSDVARMAHEYVYKGFERAVPKYVETDACEEMRWIIAHGMKGARSELAYENADEPREVMQVFREYARNCLAFMAAGYTKAEQKYGTSSALSCLFWEVAEAIAPYSKHAEFVGQQFELTITEDGRVYCDEYFEFGEELSCDDCSEYFINEGTHTVNPQGYTQCGDCVAATASRKNRSL